MRRNLRGLLFQLLNCDEHGRAAHRCRATAERADAVLHDAGVAVNDCDVVEIDAEFIGSDLRE